MGLKGALTFDVLDDYKKKFYSQEKNILARNVCSRADPYEVAQSSDIVEEVQPVFNHKVQQEGKPITDQKSTGLCWMYAGLNLIRLPFIKQYNLEEFEFSQTHLLFWHKIEESNIFLHNILKTAKDKEPLDGRLMTYLLRKPVCDGGCWPNLTCLINKYGLMPKKSFPESLNSGYTTKMNDVLDSMLRQYAKAIRDLVAKGGCDDDVHFLIQEQMSNIYRVVGICLGIPSDKFTWSYYDKDKTFKSIGPVTPKEFYEKHVKPFFNVDDKVWFVTDARPSFEYGKLYTVDFLNTVVGGERCLLNNQKVEFLLELVAKSIKEGEAVLSSCEISNQFSWKYGMHLKIHDFKLLLGVDLGTTLSKADRTLYRENGQGHSMLFTAINTNDDGEVTKLQVENSWGQDCGEKGYLTMSADFFKEFTLGAVIDKKFVPKEVLEVFEQEPIVLPAWYPLDTGRF